jgi:hypothetical protein
MVKWLRELQLLSAGALLMFCVFAVFALLADDPIRNVRWEAYAAASLIGAAFGFAMSQLASAQSARLEDLERRLDVLSANRADIAPSDTKHG